MDPATVIGLASAILTFVDFSAKIISTAKEIQSSASGATAEHEEIGKAIGRLEDLTQHLDTQSPKKTLALTPQDKKLLELQKRCITVSSELQKILESIQSKKPGSKVDSVRVALKTWKNKGKIEELQSRLDRHRQEVFGVISTAIK